ncbi:MAG TPA: pyruvate kinase, partial [Dehalococcoidia bacterium]|nr:pyruvate kinase [Dehalococcoidia bacterium]
MPEAPRATKIIATLGPATDDEQVLSAMVAAGVDVVRLNFSHGTRDEHARRVAMARRVAARLERVVAVLQDLQGPKVRIGRLRGGAAELVTGRTVRIVPGEAPGSAARLTTPYTRLADDVRPGDRILLDDGRIELRVRDARDDGVT